MQQSSDSFDLVRLGSISGRVGMGSFWENDNATSFMESHMSEVDISMWIQFGDWDQALLLEMHPVD